MRHGVFMEKHCARAAALERKVGCTGEEHSAFCTAAIVYYFIPVPFIKKSLISIQTPNYRHHTCSGSSLGAYPRPQHFERGLYLDGVFS